VSFFFFFLPPKSKKGWSKNYCSWFFILTRSNHDKTNTASAYDTVALLARAPRRVPGKRRLRVRSRPWRDACSSAPTNCSLVAGLPAAPAASPGRPCMWPCCLAAIRVASPQRRDETVQLLIQTGICLTVRTRVVCVKAGRLTFKWKRNASWFKSNTMFINQETTFEYRIWLLGLLHNIVYYIILQVTTHDFMTRLTWSDIHAWQANSQPSRSEYSMLMQSI
jgi:hypothetical protein